MMPVAFALSPTITSLSPTSKLASSSAFTLTVKGANYTSISVIYWNGISHTTTEIDTATLTTTISAAEVTTPGSYPVAVTTPGGGGGTSGSVNFTVYLAITISSLDPSSRTVSSTAFTLTVYGANFASNSIVKWKGGSRATTYYSASKLTAAISATDANTPGSAAITVTTPSVTTSGAVNFGVSNLLAPTGVTLGTVGNGFVPVQWNAVTSADSYTVAYRLSGSSSWTPAATNVRLTQFTVSGLTNNLPYDFEVIAQSSGDFPSSPSSPISATPAGTPVAPLGFTAVPGDGVVNLSWVAPPGILSGYTLTHTVGVTTTTISYPTASQVSYQDSSLMNGTSYGYSLTANNINGTGGTASVSGITPHSPPAQPTGLSVKPGNSQAVLTWDTPATAVPIYNLYRYEGATGPPALLKAGIAPLSVLDTTNPSMPNKLAYIDIGLENGTSAPFTYTYALTAQQDAAESSLASSPTVTTSPLVSMTLTPTADSYVRLDNTTNYGQNSGASHNGGLTVQSATSSTRYGYLRFDTAPGVVTAATVSLYGNSTSTTSSTEKLYKVVDTDNHSVNTWNEYNLPTPTSGIMSTNQPVTSTWLVSDNILDTQLIGTSPGWITWDGGGDVGVYVKTQSTYDDYLVSAVPAAVSQVSMALVMGDTNKSPSDVFYSRETGSNGPQLVVTRNFSRLTKGVTIYNVEDGAVGPNIDWKNDTAIPKNKKLLIESQRFGATYIETGVNRQDPSLIYKGIHILDWGFQRQNRNMGWVDDNGISLYGSFINTLSNGSAFDPDTTTQDPFHSTSLFIEAAARATLLLTQYNITAGDPVITAAISRYTLDLDAAASWLAYMYNPSTDMYPSGSPHAINLKWTFTKDYTHRYWLLAAGLGESAAVVNGSYPSDATAVAGTAHDYVTKGLLQQIASGSGNKSYISKADKAQGVSSITLLPPARLSSPVAGDIDTTDVGASINGSYTPSTEGVNPERIDPALILTPFTGRSSDYTGYDVSYQGVGMNYAGRYARLYDAPGGTLFTTGPGAVRKSDILTMMDSGLLWEATHMNNTQVGNANDGTGIMNINGCSRMGFEDNAGASTPKMPEITQLDLAFQQAYTMDATVHPEYQAWSNRIESSNSEATNLGSYSGYNNPSNFTEIPITSGWVNNTASYAIDQQKKGTDLIEQGIALDDPKYIDIGLKILDWGLAQEQSDGSWYYEYTTGPHTPSFWSSARFVEAVARAMNDLTAYFPTSASVGYTGPPTVYHDHAYYMAYLGGTGGNGINYTTKLTSAVEWLYDNTYHNPRNPSYGSNSSIYTSANQSYGTSAAFAEAWKAIGGSDPATYNLRALAQTYAYAAQGLQWTNGAILTGTVPAPDIINNQGDSLVYAELYYLMDPSPQQLISIQKGLNYTGSLIDIQGYLNGAANSHVMAAFDRYRDYIDATTYSALTYRQDNVGKS